MKKKLNKKKNNTHPETVYASNIFQKRKESIVLLAANKIPGCW